MFSSRWLAVIAFTVLLALGVTACGSSSSTTSGGEGGDSSSEVSGELAGAGSTAQQAAQEAWIAEFENANSGVTISYDPVGSGGGREQFIAGGTAFAGSDAALSTEEGELEKAEKRCEPGELIEVPNYISPIAIIYNLPEVEDLQLDPETLAKIFNQEITQWNDPAIAKDNSGVELPDTRITPVNRSDESGTTENFTEYLSEVVPSVWSYAVSGDWPVKGGEAASGTSGVVEAVSAGEGAIGYADASQAGELSVAKVKVGSEWAEPTAQAAAKVLEESPLDKELSPGKYTIAYKLDRKTESEGTYPIVLTSYLIACTKYDSAQEAEAVKAYAEYVVGTEGQELAAEQAGSAPLSSALTKKVMPAVEAIEVG
ncbi:MAG TPA: phosphate ABC transporter substrate-binding protein PstS [Solirubrobacterales bacterium]|jgi:phosphate transport system substrate-binding protein|nr:phosphate ABC transporter substrate-binding protein PstS [Solirubrobacterales bacterium]